MEQKETLIMAKINALQKQNKELRKQLEILKRKVDLIEKSLRR